MFDLIIITAIWIIGFAVCLGIILFYIRIMLWIGGEKLLYWGTISLLAIAAVISLIARGTIANPIHSVMLILKNIFEKFKSHPIEATLSILFVIWTAFRLGLVGNKGQNRGISDFGGDDYDDGGFGE